MTTNATAKQRKIQSCEVCDSGSPRSEEITNVSGVPCWLEASTPVATAATSMKNEPTSV